MTGKITLKLELSHEGNNTLEQLRIQLGHDTKAKTINTGLSLLKWAADTVKSGKDIGSLHLSEDVFTAVNMDFITHLRGKAH